MIPLAPDQALTPPTLRDYWSDRTAALLSACCELAYEPDFDTLEAALAAGGLQLIQRFFRDGVECAYLAISARLWVLAFKGTKSLDDWRIDLSAQRVPLPGAEGVHVHRGFLAAYEEMRPSIEGALEALPSTTRLYVTGHSLGGALAQIATAALERPNLSACYTFGSPRVATRDFDLAVKAPHFRVVSGFDLVPGLPAPWLSGYRHTGDPRLLTGDGVAAYRRDRSAVARLVVDLMGCAASLVTRRLPVGIADHLNYRARLAEIVTERSGGGPCGPPPSGRQAFRGETGIGQAS